MEVTDMCFNAATQAMGDEYYIVFIMLQMRKNACDVDRHSGNPQWVAINKSHDFSFISWMLRDQRSIS
jgi:hypothetical protein